MMNLIFLSASKRMLTHLLDPLRSGTFVLLYVYVLLSINLSFCHDEIRTKSQIERVVDVISVYLLIFIGLISF